MSLRDAVLEAYCEVTGFVKDAEAKAMAKGLAEGRSEGQAQGRVEEARKLLRVALRSKFPILENLPEIDCIDSLDKLEALMESLFHETDAGTIRDAILAGVKPN